MLVLSRKKNESIVINDNITIVVVEIRGDKVRLGIEAPKETPVHRREVYDAIRREEVSRDTTQIAIADVTVTETATETGTPDATATATASTEEKKDEDEDAEDNTPLRPPPRNNMMDVTAVTLGYVCIVGLSGLGGYTVITWIGDLLKPWMN